MGGNTITTTVTPTGSSHLTSKSYVDAPHLAGLYISAATQQGNGGAGTLSPDKQTLAATIYSGVVGTSDVTLCTFTFTNSSPYIIPAGTVWVYMAMTSTVATANNFTYTFNLSGGITVTTTSTATLSSTASIIGASFTISENTFVNSNIALQLIGRNATSATMTIASSPNPYLYFKRNETIYPSMTPIGSIIQYGSTRPPFGYLLCNGDLYNTTGIFADLFSVIGYTYGGSGSQFEVPDFQSRFAVGAASTGTIAGLGTVPVPSATLKQGGSSTIEQSQLPTHTHQNSVSVTQQPTFSGTGTSTSLSSGSARVPANTYYSTLVNTNDNFSGGSTRSAVQAAGAHTKAQSAAFSVTGTCPAQDVTVNPLNSGTIIAISNASIGSGTAYWQPHTAVNFIIKY